MPSRNPLLVLALVVFSASLPAGSAEKLTANTWRLSPGEKSPAATLADMGWLTGHWQGEALGGTTEEVWVEPVGPNMAGLFRLHKAGKTIFYEILAVTELDGSLMFRLKHFNADLTGWEEKAEVQTFPLVSKRPDEMHFQGMSFHPAGDSLTVYLAVEHKDKPPEELKFTYRRVRQEPKP